MPEPRCDQSATLAWGVATLVFAFAVDLALTGDAERALEAVSASRRTEPDEPAVLENPFWD